MLPRMPKQKDKKTKWQKDKMTKWQKTQKDEKTKIQNYKKTKRQKDEKKKRQPAAEHKEGEGVAENAKTSSKSRRHPSHPVVQALKNKFLLLNKF